MAKVELKQPIVDEIINNVKDAESVVLVNYSGLTVEQDTALRKELREAGVVYKVYKNTMMHRAFEGTQCEELIQHLHGTNALAISATDATAPARILDKFAKKNPALEFIAAIKELSVLELNDLVKACEEEFGVSAAAGVVVAAAGAAEAAEEKDEFDVELAEVGPNKVKVIKVVREVTGLGLKEAKEMVDGAPKVVKEGASKAESEDIKTKLEAEGAKVNLK